MLPLKRIHFVGIGGVGMSAIAWVLLKKGIPVSGSDLHSNPLTTRLEENGATIFYEHSPLNLEDVGLVVASSAIREDNPEIVHAGKLNIPIWHRSVMLAEILDEGEAITVAGTHGKTTTTSMISLLLRQAGLDPTVLIGGDLPDMGGNALLGSGTHIVAEADESDGTLLAYHPRYAVITNVDSDHLDFYKTEDAVRRLFHTFLSQIQPDGFAIVCADDPGVRFILNPPPSCGVCSYSILSSSADCFARDITLSPRGSSFSVFFQGLQLGSIALSVPGKHNVSNALAVVSLGQILGIDFDIVQKTLQMFKGVKRRFQNKGEAEGILVVDDYGHHPTEVASTLNGALPLAKKRGGRIVTVFQPHRFTRTQALAQDFARAFDDADVVLVTDVYSAGENPIEGVSGRLIYEALVNRGHPAAHYVENMDDICDKLLGMLLPADVVITMGAGNIWKVGEQLLQCLERQIAKMSV